MANVKGGGRLVVVPLIPKGKLTMLEGNPGIGERTWLSLAIATSLSVGSGLPGAEFKSPAKVLLVSFQQRMALPDTIRPRFDSLKADTANISYRRAAHI